MTHLEIINNKIIQKNSDLTEIIELIKYHQNDKLKIQLYEKWESEINIQLTLLNELKKEFTKL